MVNRYIKEIGQSLIDKRKAAEEQLADVNKKLTESSEWISSGDGDSEGYIKGRMNHITEYKIKQNELEKDIIDIKEALNIIMQATKERTGE